MRDYIDRQAAIDAIEKLILPQKKGETAAEEINRVAWLCAINCAEEMIGHLQSADVEPVRHGRWMEENPLDAPDCRLIRCSECGKSFIVPMNVPYEHWIDGRNYCYSCGARMDGDKDETAEADYEWSKEEQAYIEQGYMDTQVGLPDLYMN